MIAAVFGGGATVGRHQDPLKQKSGSEPERGKVQTDQMADIPAAAAIVPGTERSLLQKASGEVFGGEDQAHIGKSAEPEGSFF